MESAGTKPASCGLFAEANDFKANEFVVKMTESSRVILRLINVVESRQRLIDAVATVEVCQASERLQDAYVSKRKGEILCARI